jgi:serine protease Do
MKLSLTVSMKLVWVLLTATSFVCAQPLIFPIAEDPVKLPSDIPENVIEKVDPSVVSIQHEKAGGTGFIISEDGYILSNGHVVRGDDPEQPMEPAKSITVILNDDRKYPAQVLGFSMDPDVALLKINTGFPLKPVEFGDSTKANVGQRVFAVGTPVGLKRTFTSGILSNIERTDLNTETIVFQTDAAINSGNSGGPLFDQQGRVLGINTYGRNRSNNIGFTIPIHYALDMIEDLKTRGRFVRSLIPLYFTSELYDELAITLQVEKGIMITYVMEDSSAYKMGLRHGDIIIKRNGEPVSARSKAELLKLDWEDTTRPAGEEYSLTILRGTPGDRKEFTFRAPLEELPPMPAFGRHAGELHEHRYETLGLGVEMLTDLHHIVHEIPAGTQGVFVKTVKDNSVASRAGIKENDVLVFIGDKPVTNIQDFRTSLDEALADNTTAIETHIVRRKINLVTALAPDYLMKGQKIILIIPEKDSTDVDLIRRELLSRGAQVLIASPNKVDILRPEVGIPLKANMDLEKVKKQKADVILFVGGNGAKAFWEDETALDIVRSALKNEKQVLGAIGPAALLPALASEEDLELKITLPQELSGEAVRRGATYTGKDVESDKKLITTTGQERNIIREFLQSVVSSTSP